MVFGLKLRFIDTPGLQTAAESFSRNSRVLKQINAARKKFKPKLVVYCDRLDTVSRSATLRGRDEGTISSVVALDCASLQMHLHCTAHTRKHTFQNVYQI